MEFNKPDVFHLDGDLASNFLTFRAEVKIYMTATQCDKMSNAVQVASLKNLMGPEAFRLYKTITTLSKKQETVAAILKVLEDHCNPYKNGTILVFNFLNRTQGEGEPFRQFYASLKSLAAMCDFDDQLDKLLCAQIVRGIRSKATQECLLRENLPLDKVVAFCRSSELAERGMKDISSGNTYEEVKVKARSHPSYNVQGLAEKSGARFSYPSSGGGPQRPVPHPREKTNRDYDKVVPSGDAYEKVGKVEARSHPSYNVQGLAKKSGARFSYPSSGGGPQRPVPHPREKTNRDYDKVVPSGDAYDKVGKVEAEYPSDTESQCEGPEASGARFSRPSPGDGHQRAVAYRPWHGAKLNRSYLANGVNPVSLLNEICASRRYKTPEYNMVKEKGPDHVKMFIMKVTVKGVDYIPTKISYTKKVAKREAALACLESLGYISNS